MKKLICLLALTLVMALPAKAQASDQVGVYISPKFVYGLTYANKVKTHEAGEAIKFGHDTDSVYGGSLALGYDFAPAFNVPVRMELEYAIFSEAEATDSKTVDDVRIKHEQSYQVQTIMANFYWDFETATAFTPYIGVGLGMAIIDTEAEANVVGYGKAKAGSDTVTNFAASGTIGLEYAFNHNWSMDMGYRFIWLGEAETKRYKNTVGRSKTDDLWMHQLFLGLRYTF
ncbi:porin family protein [Desulfovibrio sp. OttesenSCG-928-C14]|nr:porin family protein [Desulfovibrio sp. OttesenSCG-928-C14]